VIDMLFRSTTRKDFEAMARTAGFISDDVDPEKQNRPLPDITIDPQIGTPEYETGIPIVDVPGSGGGDEELVPPVLKTGWHCNVRLSGEREQQEIDGLEQTDAEGNLLPVSERTHFGIAFSDNGTVVADGTTEGVQYANVALINELTIVSPQRVWQ
jgi:hypothetical protein